MIKKDDVYFDEQDGLYKVVTVHEVHEEDCHGYNHPYIVAHVTLFNNGYPVTTYGEYFINEPRDTVVWNDAIDACINRLINYKI